MQVRGVRPFFSEKYDITRHPRYQYLSDADKKNTFDVDSYLCCPGCWDNPMCVRKPSAPSLIWEGAGKEVSPHDR